jgi:AbrB family looped-hinge helix DNA binding protein
MASGGKTTPLANVDSKGRIMLPIGIRYQLDLNAGDQLAIDDLGDGTIIIKKVYTRAIFDSLLNGDDVS